MGASPVSPPKPRRYDGPVDFIDDAAHMAALWPEETLEDVVSFMPYPPERGVRMKDWVILVAHVANGHSEEPAVCAKRLALYATAYAERHTKLPSPATIQRTQDARPTEETP